MNKLFDEILSRLRIAWVKIFKKKIVWNLFCPGKKVKTTKILKILCQKYKNFKISDIKVAYFVTELIFDTRSHDQNFFSKNRKFSCYQKKVWNFPFSTEYNSSFSFVDDQKSQTKYSYHMMLQQNSKSLIKMVIQYIILFKQIRVVVGKSVNIATRDPRTRTSPFKDPVYRPGPPIEPDQDRVFGTSSHNLCKWYIKNVLLQ